MSYDKMKLITENHQTYYSCIWIYATSAFTTARLAYPEIKLPYVIEMHAVCVIE